MKSKDKDVENIVRRLLNDGKDQHTNAEYGLALFKAISTQQPKIVHSLLAAGAPVNTPYNKGKTCLHLAMEQNRTDLVKLLMQFGADNQIKDGNQQTPMNLAVSKNNWESVQAMAEAQQADKDDKAGYGRALFNAIYIIGNYGNYRVAPPSARAISSLIAAGAPATTPCYKGMTCLHLAMQQNRPGLVKLLMQSGADNQIKDGNQQTPMNLAVSKNNWESVQAMAEAQQADKDDKAGYGRALFNAIYIIGNYGNYRVKKAVSSLIAAGAPVNTPYNNGKTCLHLAMERNYPDLVKLLMQSGASLEQAERLPVTSNYPGAKVLDDDFYLVGEVEEKEKDAMANSSLETGMTYEADGKLDQAICCFMQAIEKGHSKAAYDALRDFLYRLSTNTQDGSFDSIPKQTLIDAIKKLPQEEQLFLFKEECLIRKTPLGKRMWKKEDTSIFSLECGLGRNELKDICVYIKDKLDPNFSIKEIEAINSSKSTTGSIFFAESNRYRGHSFLNHKDVVEEKIFEL